ncbi:unnamed protein product [Cylicostephanus goldi]|uniref:Uncharacterized protein n=1 Tax=Cylicostephanus goldi TaxID=71465 RepID=A0A3P6SP40_CYLGO|nr:unnamed protein product [Cylicostephanus goldi]
MLNLLHLRRRSCNPGSQRCLADVTTQQTYLPHHCYCAIHAAFVCQSPSEQYCKGC